MTVDGGEIRAVEHIHSPELEDAKILAITEDLAGDLWLNGSQGLYRYQPATGRVKRYVSDDGLQSNTWTEGAAVSDNGWLFVGGINGINYFNPSDFRTDPYPGEPMFTGLKVFGQRVVPGGEYDGRVLLREPLNRTRRLELGYRQSNFTLEFTSDQYVNPAKNLFRYRLEGYDPDWTVVGAGQRFAAYTRLPARLVEQRRGLERPGAFVGDRRASGALGDLVGLFALCLCCGCGGFCRDILSGVASALAPQTLHAADRAGEDP